MYTTKQLTYIAEHCTSLSTDDQKHRYDDCLDECYEPIKFGDLSYLPSDVLKSVDPVAYRCGLNDFIGTDDNLVEIDGEFYEIEDVNEALDAMDDGSAE